jgi:hypothetical protein
MNDDDQGPDETDLTQHLMRDLADGLPGKLARSRRLVELSGLLGEGGTFMHGGETPWVAFEEARWSFIHGNYIATVQLCQGVVEHVLAALLHGALLSSDLPPRITFSATIQRCLESGILDASNAAALRTLSELRNPLAHFRNLDDETHLSRRMLSLDTPSMEILAADADTAIETVHRVLGLPQFRLGPSRAQAGS